MKTTTDYQLCLVLREFHVRVIDIEAATALHLHAEEPRCLWTAPMQNPMGINREGRRSFDPDFVDVAWKVNQ